MRRRRSSTRSSVCCAAFSACASTAAVRGAIPRPRPSPRPQHAGDWFSREATADEVAPVASCDRRTRARVQVSPPLGGPSTPRAAAVGMGVGSITSREDAGSDGPRDGQQYRPELRSVESWFLCGNLPRRSSRACGRAVSRPRSGRRLNARAVASVRTNRPLPCSIERVSVAVRRFGARAI